MNELLFKAAGHATSHAAKSGGGLFGGIHLPSMGDFGSMIMRSFAHGIGWQAARYLGPFVLVIVVIVFVIGFINKRKEAKADAEEQEAAQRRAQSGHENARRDYED